MHPTPGIRFARIGGSTEPQHLLDIWMKVDASRYADYVNRPEPYRAFQHEIDGVFGRSARFVFVGELDPREDLSVGHRLAEILDEVGVDILHPVASGLWVDASLHEVKRWPGYYILLQGWATGQAADWANTKTYVFQFKPRETV